MMGERTNGGNRPVDHQSPRTSQGRGEAGVVVGGDLVLGVVRARVRVVVPLPGPADEGAVQDVGLGGGAAVAVRARAAGGAAVVRGLD